MSLDLPRRSIHLLELVRLIACENSVSPPRNVLSGEERGETAVFAGYSSHEKFDVWPRPYSTSSQERKVGNSVIYLKTLVITLHCSSK